MAYLAKIDDAIVIPDRVIVRFPNDADSYFYRGFAKVQAKKDAEARPDLEKYIALAPLSAPQVAKAKELFATIK